MCASAAAEILYRTTRTMSGAWRPLDLTQVNRTFAVVWKMSHTHPCESLFRAGPRWDVLSTSCKRTTSLRYSWSCPTDVLVRASSVQVRDRTSSAPHASKPQVRGTPEVVPQRSSWEPLRCRSEIGRPQHLMQVNHKSAVLRKMSQSHPREGSKGQKVNLNLRNTLHSKLRMNDFVQNDQFFHIYKETVAS
jgi:hypothetical protein